MTVTISRLFEPTLLTTAPVTLFAMPATPTGTVLNNGEVRFVNTNTGGGTPAVYLFAVPSGQAPGLSNAILNGETIANPGHLDIDISQLGPGDSLQAYASASSSVVVSALAGSVFS
jgi:hypothetical protein